jgi:hypothetical protein
MRIAIECFVNEDWFMRAKFSIGFSYLLLIGLAGCAGNGEGLDQNGQPATGAASSALTADFDSIQENVFTPICSVCHAGAGAPVGLRLDAANSYALLVGVASVEVPSLQRIRPGAPDTSYLIQKIQGTNAVGDRMPRGGPYLPQATIDIIRQWVANGAPRTQPASVSVTASEKTGLSVATTSPVDGAQVEWPLGQIVISFDRELDANLVNSSTISLIDARSGLPLAASFAVSLSNPFTVIVTPQSALGNGSYRLELRGSGGGALAGLDALPLNAKAPESAMPKDRVGEGQDFSLEFSVEVRP